LSGQSSERLLSPGLGFDLLDVDAVLSVIDVNRVAQRLLDQALDVPPPAAEHEAPELSVFVRQDDLDLDLSFNVSPRLRRARLARVQVQLCASRVESLVVDSALRRALMASLIAPFST
jgi:hypothetical protein